MKTIKQSDIEHFISLNLSVRVQSNGLVFVGEKIELDKQATLNIRNGKTYSVLKEEVYRLID